MKTWLALTVGAVGSVANGYGFMVASRAAEKVSDALLLSVLASIFVLPVLGAVALWRATWATWRAKRTHWGWLFAVVPGAVILSVIGALVAWSQMPATLMNMH